MVKVVLRDSSLVVTIPKTKARRAGYKVGDEVDIEFNERGNLEIIKMGKC